MDELKRLRAAIQRERRASRGQAHRGFSEGLRQRVVEHVSGERAKGGPVGDLIAGIGISRPTYYAWERNRGLRKGEPQFREVSVVREPVEVGGRDRSVTALVPVNDSASGSKGIVVMVPHGVAVVGMTVSDVAELVRRLGC